MTHVTNVLCAVAGLAVDWINDRIYWIESIIPVVRVYDLKTNVTSTVMNLPTFSKPMKLKVLPHLG